MASVTLYPASVDTSISQYQSVNSSYPFSNAVGKDSSNTTYALWNLKTGSSAETYVFYKFDCSEIPTNVTISSVSCSAKVYINQTNSSRINSRKVLLYCGNSTAMGSASNVSTSTTAINLTCGTWTRELLNNCYIRIYTKRGTSSTTSTYYNRFYGARLTVNYELNGETYTVTTTILNGSITLPVVRPTTVQEGESIEYKFSGNSGYEFQSMTVNGTSVTPTKLTVAGSTDFSLSTNYSTYLTYALDNAKDGVETSYFWSSEALTVGKYILLTFETPIKLTYFETYSSSSTDRPGSNNVLLVSTNGTEWETIGTFEDSNTSTFNGINKENVKYARIYCQTEISSWLVLNEITIEALASDAEYYTYTLSNITSDKTVEIIFSVSGINVYIKQDGSWVLAKALYKKVSGSWVLITSSFQDYLESPF